MFCGISCDLKITAQLWADVVTKNTTKTIVAAIVVVDYYLKSFTGSC